MADWSVLGLSGDPVPGDPGQVLALARRLTGCVDVADTSRDRLRSVASDVSGGPLQARGDYAAAYAEQIGELPDLLGELGTAYRGCADALGRYSGALDTARARSRTALTRGEDALQRYRQARQQADALLPPDRVLPWRSAPGYVGLVCGVSRTQVDAVTGGMDESLRGQVRVAVRRAQQAAADQQVARRLADEAAALRGEAAARCAGEIDAALDGSGIKNKAWYEKAWDAVGAPFRSWDAFVDFCGKVALVAGVVALFVSGPLGWALMAGAMIAGGVLLGDALAKYARGEGSLLDVGLAVLGVIPGGRGVVSLTRLARGARALIPALARGGGKLLGKGAYGLRTAIPHGLVIAGGLRGAARNPAQFARATACRAFGADPVDLATGEMVIDVADVQLPGSLPLTLRRIHQSSYRVGHRLGPAWNSTLDHRLEEDDGGIAYTGADGTVLLFPHPADAEGVEPSEGARLLLRSVGDGEFTVTDPLTGVTGHFARLHGLSGVTALPMVAVTDRAGRRIDYRHDADGYLVEIVHTGGYHLRLEHDDGLVSAVRLARAGEDGADRELVRYRYDAVGRLTEVVNSSGLPMRYTYDAAGRLVGWQDRNGTWYRYDYDDEGRCIRADGTDAVLRAEFTYRAAQAHRPARTEYTDSLGHAWTYDVNDRCQIVASADPTGAVRLHEWDRHHRPLLARDPLGRTTRYAYDEVGNQVRVTFPDGHELSTRYDANSLPVSVRLPDGSVVSADHDAAGLLLSRSDPDGTVSTYAYDDRGHLSTFVDPLGGVTRVVCDAAGLPVRVTDPLGAITTVTRDAFGRPVLVTDQVGGVTRLTWSVEGRLTGRVDPDGAQWSWAYDGEDNLRVATDPVGRGTRHEPTPFDQTARVITPDGAVTEYVYDTERRLAAVVNPQALVWRYVRDGAGRIIAETDFDGATTTYERDAAGQVLRRTNAAGQAVEHTWDARGNLVGEWSAGRTTWWEYDVNARLVRATTPDVDLRLARDELGRVTAETVNGHILAFRHDAVGRLVGRRTPSGAESSWSFDAAGRPVTLETSAGAPALAFDRDGAGRPAGLRFGGAALRRVVDPVGRPLSQTITSLPAPDAVLMRRDFSYTLDGYLDEIDDLLTGVHSLALDPTGRITARSGPQGAERYGYDVAGNIVDGRWPPDATGEPGARGTRRYSGSLLRRAGSFTYTYDAAGRLTRRRQRLLSGGVRTWTYSWDAHDRLTTVHTADGAWWQYTYDAFGRRVSKRRLSGDPQACPDVAVVEEILFTWDGPLLVEVRDRGSDVVTTFDHEPGTFVPVAQRTRTPRGGSTDSSGPSDDGQPPAAPSPDAATDHDDTWYDEQFHAIITDLVGTPTDLIDADGNVFPQPPATVWGARLGGDPGESSGAGVRCPLGFPGQYHDLETGLAYNFVRYYDRETARYSTPDPLGLGGGPNPHAYVSNPLHWLDPLGLTPYGMSRGGILYHGTSTGNARGIRASGIDLSLANPRTDFGAGFYTTTDRVQALTRAGGDQLGLLEFHADPSMFSEMSGLTFASAGHEYERFLRSVRDDGMHSYDFVSGPVLANPRAFYAGSPAVTFGNQTSFHREAAVHLLFGGLT